ncbi:MAG: CvpA family protein [Spirochaetota bacterium]
MKIPPIDIFFGAILVIAAIRCAVRGFVTEIMSMAAVILGIGGAVLFSGSGGRIVERYFKLSNWNQIIAFLAIFLIIYLIVKIFEKAISGFIEHLNLGSLDQALGLFLGLIEGFLVITVIILIVEIQPFFDAGTILNQSFFSRIILSVLPYGAKVLGGNYFKKRK